MTGKNACPTMNVAIKPFCKKLVKKAARLFQGRRMAW
jgi:hypothetical protein